MNQLTLVNTDIYKPTFDVESDNFVDKSPYKPYERHCIRYECRCRAGSYFVGGAQYKQHIKSKTHKDFIKYYKKYYKESDENKIIIKELTGEKELLLRKNSNLMETTISLHAKVNKLTKQNKKLMETIIEMNDDSEFQECENHIDS